MHKPILIAAVLAALLAGTGGAAAQAYPTRPITMIIPSAAGAGAADVTGPFYTPGEGWWQPVRRSSNSHFENLSWRL